MAQDTAHRKYKFAGRALLTPKERSSGKGLQSFPWYASAEWLKRKEAIATRVKNRIARVQDRKKAREEMRKRGLLTT